MMLWLWTPILESTMTEDKARMLKPGTTRVRDHDGFVGTVMHVGPVASAKDQSEIYAGIVWDDPSRGKHDGSVICRKTNQLVRHFSCSKQAGSFMRLSKLDLGVVLDENLLRERYVELDAPVVAPNNLLPQTAMTTSGREKPIEFLGELKIRARQQLPDLDKIVLRSMGISMASSDPSSLSEFSHIREMDLAGNLIGDWDTVLQILRQFPSLEKISLASNRIQDIPEDYLSNDVDLSRLKVLNLNDCSIRSFRTVQWIAKMAPNLEELCLAYSDLSEIESAEKNETLSGFYELQFLDCSSCGLTSWEKQAHVFGTLPVLEHLILNDNAISNIPTSTNDSVDEFKALNSLQLAGTAIATWKDLDGLNSLKSLRSLRFRRTPLTSTMGAGEARAITIARLPNLEYLNSSRISPQERFEAERRYVSNVARDLLMVTVGSQGQDEEAKREDLLRSHPIFTSLMEKHKESMEASTQSSGGTGANMAQLALNVTVRSMAASSCNMEPLRKRLPGSLTVGRLKLMCSRAFGLDIDLQVLHFRVDNDPFPIELDNDDNTLAYYGVRDGSEILMNEVDLDAQVREAARVQQEQDLRIETQENDARTLQELRRSDVKARSLAVEKAAARLQ